MDQQTVEEYILKLANVHKEYPFGEETAVFGVAGEAPVTERMFALMAEGASPVRLSLRCDSRLAQLLRERYESVMPGEHLNKKYWNTLVLSGQLTDDEVRDLIRHAYNLVAGSEVTG